MHLARAVTVNGYTCATAKIVSVPEYDVIYLFPRQPRKAAAALMPLSVSEPDMNCREDSHLSHRTWLKLEPRNRAKTRVIAAVEVAAKAKLVNNLPFRKSLNCGRTIYSGSFHHHMMRIQHQPVLSPPLVVRTRINPLSS